VFVLFHDSFASTFLPSDFFVFQETIKVIETEADKLPDEGIIATSATNSKGMHRNTKDIFVEKFSINFFGKILIDESDLTLNFGRRYGVIGPNGCGKSTLMRVLGARGVPIPSGIDIFHLKEEIEPTETSALDCVLTVDAERLALEEEVNTLSDAMADDDGEGDESDALQERLDYVLERLEDMDAATAEVRATSILSGLGFTKAMMHRATNTFSGGWRMRVSLARALFIKPTLLVLDEPTNHLDMEAVIWLEDYLSKWNRILFLVSHSQDFMNAVCTNIVHINNKRLIYYAGNYDMFVQTRKELEEQQMKKYNWEQEEIRKMKEYIARFGHGSSKLARQAQSKEKTLEKMVRGGLTEKVVTMGEWNFDFNDPGTIPPPVLQFQEVTFGYDGAPALYEKVDFGLDLDSRVALVGPNGAGKSTLLKLITGDLNPRMGSVRPHSHLRIGVFSQHFADALDTSMTPLEYMLSEFPTKTLEDMRKYLGRYGCSGAVQTQVIEQLSDGQKARVCIAHIAARSPHMLLLDEPTNHLDMESIDSLARAINNFKGGLVLVSHDMRLIGQVAKEIWMVDNNTVEPYKGDIMDFKKYIRKQLKLDVAGASVKITRGDGQSKSEQTQKKKGGDKKGGKNAPAPAPKREVAAPPAGMKVIGKKNDEDFGIFGGPPKSTGGYVPPHKRNQDTASVTSSATTDSFDM
jgi:ATP-binding cassette subfamily F protein 2